MTFLFIYFNIIWINIFHSDNIIEKVLCVIFNPYHFLFILFIYYLVSFNSLFVRRYDNKCFFCFIFYQVTVNTNSYQ